MSIRLFATSPFKVPLANFPEQSFTVPFDVLREKNLRALAALD
jgi:hypothetical protein